MQVNVKCPLWLFIFEMPENQICPILMQLLMDHCHRHIKSCWKYCKLENKFLNNHVDYFAPKHGHFLPFWINFCHVWPFLEYLFLVKIFPVYIPVVILIIWRLTSGQFVTFLAIVFIGLGLNLLLKSNIVISMICNIWGLNTK